jgi:2-polyprenyl-3-methyl-5-hydroxy-6-metoxy-1,4-benzoquinol methylase
MKRIDDFKAVLTMFVPAGGRVLEIGAGEGLLAQTLARAGYQVTALEPRPRGGAFPVVASSFEAFEAPGGSFDCVCAQLVLHHIADLPATLEKIASLLRPGGVLAIDDYGWERSEDAAFRADRADLHTAETMLPALRAASDEIYYADHAYFDEGAGTDKLGFTFVGRRRAR